jgi:hypothetical protein
MTDGSAIYSKARGDVAAMLGFDLDDLAPEQALRIDVASALRVLLDNQSGRLVRGESLDARELLMASEALSRLLPPEREPAAGPREDPRQVMFRIYMEMRERGEVPPEGHYRHRIAELEAENERLRAGLHAPGLERASGAPSAFAGSSAVPREAAIDPTEVVPPGEWRGVPPMRGLDDPPKIASAIIDAKANPPAAPRNWDDSPNGRAWNEWRAAAAGGGGSDPWSNRNGV